MLTELQKQEIVWLLTNEMARRSGANDADVARAYNVTEDEVRALVRAARHPAQPS